MDAMKLINNLCEGYNAAADEPAMQELKPLPCPLCGNKEPKVNRGCGVVTCCEIYVEDVAAWNTLPRAMRWTHEQPKVAGWYFQRTAGEDQTINVAYVYSGLAGLYCKCGCRNTPLKCWIGFEWAGPISAPIEP